MKIYNPEIDLWIDGSGNEFIRNEFDVHNPIWIPISEDVWSVPYGGNVLKIDWTVLDQKPFFKSAFKAVAKLKMESNSAAYLSKINNLISALSALLDNAWEDFSDIPADAMVTLWSKMHASNRIILREFLQNMSSLEIGGASSDLAYEVKLWKARSEVQTLKDVLQWNKTRGALIFQEEELLRKILKTKAFSHENAKNQGLRIYGWIVLNTLKRSSQVLRIAKDGLKEVVGSDGKSEWFVEIEPIKFQTGMETKWWGIEKELAYEIQEYSSRKLVSELQEQFNRLIVWETPSLLNHGVISPAEAKNGLTEHIAKRKIVSPRTNRPLHVTAARIRHTGATNLAFQGVARDIIQEILEHDCPESAKAYIDAVGSNIVPAIERAGRMMGGIFQQLNKSFFQGKVVKAVKNNPPVVIPEFSPNPVIVGVCMRDTVKDGVCPKHPFLSCYDGCNCFSAWDNSDPHTRALRYFESELARWEKAVGGNTDNTNPAANAVVQTYQRAASAVREVLSQIQGDS